MKVKIQDKEYECLHKLLPRSLNNKMGFGPAPSTQIGIAAADFCSCKDTKPFPRHRRLMKSLRYPNGRSHAP